MRIRISKKYSLIVLILYLVIQAFYVNSKPKITPESTPNAGMSGEVAGINTIKVTDVIDGDTFEIEGGEKVRLIGIDTPETRQPGKSVECFGKEASEKAKELVNGKFVRLEKDISERDRFGRLLRYVYIEDKFINNILVAEGYAFAASFPPDIKYQSVLQESERIARQERRGLWGSSCK